MRYGQNISESGIGGMTTGNSGSANQGDGFERAAGGSQSAGAKDEAEASRTEQGYGPGSGVGA